MLLGLYKLILQNNKLGINKDTLAIKILPFLLPLCIDQSFSPNQYELLISLVNEMITQVTMEHREALQQLQKTRQFHENMTDTLNNMTSSNNSHVDTLSLSLGLFESNSSATPSTFVSSPQTSQSKTLSLDEKIR